MTTSAGTAFPEEAITCSITMRWGDMDAYGHINNVEVVRILEEARIGAFGPPGGTGRPGRETEVPFFSSLPAETQALVVEHRVKYKASLEYRNIPLNAKVWVSDLKAASLAINYLLLDPVTDVVCVTAQTSIAFVSAESGRLQRISPEQKAMVVPYEAASIME
ncbi:acyl-CoA thioesterase [Arthrobacter sp. H14]|uniref:acyl-CoA thioesterase n=1 Tax=Arthrobacter sp. H14 TaxID=1312959 RepID=UPI00047A5A5F|nr:thioesterase family protein [Arthrobacter sp. H14]